MSPQEPTPIDLDRLAPEAVPGIRILPVVHERVEMAAVARAVLDRLGPAAVAVELPTTLADAVVSAIRRLPRISLVISEEPGEEALVWTAAPGDPFVEALRWADERRRPFFCIDPDLRYGERHPDPVPDPYALLRIGPERYMELLQLPLRGLEVSDQDRRREAGMAFHAVEARGRIEEGELLVLVGAVHADGLAEALQDAQAHPFARVRRSSVELRHLHPRSLTGLLPDPPLAHAVWERVRGGEEIEPADLEETVSRKVSVVRFGLRVITGEGGEDEARRRRRLVRYACDAGTSRRWEGPPVPDRGRLGGVVWRTGSGSWSEQTGESPGPWQRRMFFDFGRRCARLGGQLVPGLYEWVVAARGVADDNLAWEVFDAARTYPWQEEAAEIATVKVDGDQLDLGTRRIRFRRRFLRVKRRPVAIPVRERPRPEDPEDWLRGFDGSGVCSYPPEDLVIEDYGRFLQKKALSLLSAERKRSEPFSASLLDGIDIRETLRNLHEERIWVEELGRVPGGAGSVVVIFDHDREGGSYPFRMSWLGEHEQESDMAFYSTDPAEQVVGPGILRATYGGFMLTLPRGRLFDVWGDPDYRFGPGGLIRDKAELLLMAAIDYSLEKIVVHVAGEIPPDRLRRYAAAQSKQVLHIPLASLSPMTLKKIRVVHILAGRNKREIAKNYVW